MTLRKPVNLLDLNLHENNSPSVNRVIIQDALHLYDHIYFPKGIYQVNGPIVVDRAQRIDGPGRCSTKLVICNDEFIFVCFPKYSGHGVQNGPIIENIHLESKEEQYGSGILISSTQTMKIRETRLQGLRIQGMCQGIHLLAHGQGCYFNLLENLVVADCINGIRFSAQSVEPGEGCHRNALNNIRIQGYENTECGLDIESGDTNDFYRINFQGITTPENDGTACFIDTKLNTFTNCTFENNDRDVSLLPYSEGNSFRYCTLAPREIKDMGKNNCLVTVPGDNGRSRVAFKNVSYRESVPPNSTKTLEYFSVPANRKLRIYSGNCLGVDANENPYKGGIFKMEFVDITDENDTEVIHTFSNKWDEKGYPLKEFSWPESRNFIIRFKNEHQTKHIPFIGKCKYSVDGQ